MSQLKNKTILSLILIFSIFALIAAYFIQYTLGHKPCNLCLIERLPYIFAIFLITFVLILKKFKKFIFILLVLTFISATFISFYHYGIEQGFFKESLACDAGDEINELSKENLLRELKNKSTSCKDINFTIFGLSLATINTFISLALSIITIKIFLNYEKNK